MSCGLGAVAMIFLLVKHNVDKTEIPTEQVNYDLEKKLETLTSQKKKLNIEKLNLEKNLKTQIQENQILVQNIMDYQGIEKNILSRLKEQRENQISIEKSITNINISKKQDNIFLEGLGETDYLIGLKIEGEKIAIILDTSSSMTDEKLIDIISRKNTSEKNIKNGPKWQRTLRVVQWILARVPKETEYMVIQYAEKANILNGNNWKNNSPKNLQNSFQEVVKIIPNGATNLSSALEVVKSLNGKPDSIYIITDGLPTKGRKNYSNLSIFSNCSSISSSSQKINGKCRERLFNKTVADFKSFSKGLTINVILFPLEGDPSAAPNYWYWTANSGGVTIVPASDWP